MPGESAWNKIRGSFKNEEQIAIEAMFPATNKFQMKQMTTEFSQRAIVPMAVLGVFRRIYKSKVLEMFQEEYMVDKDSLERQGRFELRDIVAAKRISAEEKDKD